MHNISVVLPVYNGQTTLRESLISVAEQNVLNTEVILIDDGSNDCSLMIAQDFATEFQSQNIIIHSQKNKGLAASLNIGIHKAKGRYIARQDQDDIVLKGRFEKQFEYLENNPKVAMVGTRAQIYVGQDSTDRCHNHAISSNTIKLELLFDNPFVHSSVMIRKSILDELGGYSEDNSRQPPEDYELWSRVSQKYELANLPEVLTIYREMPTSMSRTGQNPFLTNVLQISAENLFFRLSPTYSFDKCLALTKIYHGVKVQQSDRLSNTVMQKMLMYAAVNIAGPSDMWSEEFSFNFDRISKHLTYRSISRRLPSFLFKLLHRLKLLLIKIINSLNGYKKQNL